jgi:hypothetical protein
LSHNKPASAGFLLVKKEVDLYSSSVILVFDIHTFKEIIMSADKTIEALKEFCTKNSGDTFGQIWQGNKSTYHWNIGKVDAKGIVNGVVRKLAGIDANGSQIWVVAGSFKIDPNGTILRFTGLPRKFQKEILDKVTQPIVTNTTVTV